MLVLHDDAQARLPGLWAAAVIVRKEGWSEEGLPGAQAVVDPAWHLDTLKDDPIAAGYRKLSWALGIDPTKNRPSGEALARRILAGKPLPKIHPLVDAYNLASAQTLVPLSAYDLDHIEPPLTVRPATEVEPFHGIGRDPERLDAGRIVYADAAGHVAGVALWRDALATRVREETQRALLLAIGADPVPPEAGDRALDAALAMARRVGFTSEGDSMRVPVT
ncbi:MAG: hypothetical protein KY455_12735 [Euryarchaeota archaeon]|nr:hypothetical protein [Euryarchaeota archaeon]